VLEQVRPLCRCATRERAAPGEAVQGAARQLLSWSTFSDAADEAGFSRRYGGIHFEQGDLDARATGRIAAWLAWQKAREHWEGT